MTSCQAIKNAFLIVDEMMVDETTRCVPMINRNMYIPASWGVRNHLIPPPTMSRLNIPLCGVWSGVASGGRGRRGGSEFL